LQAANQPIDRRDFLKLAGIAPLVTASGDRTDHAQTEPDAGTLGDRLDAEGNWTDALTVFEGEADKAWRSGDTWQWARLRLRAAQMRTNLGRFSEAGSDIRVVLSHPLLQTPSGSLAQITVARAWVQAGWIFQEQDKREDARKAFTKALRLLLASTGNSGSDPLQVLQLDWRRLYSAAHDANAMDVLETSVHFLGRLAYTEHQRNSLNDSLLAQSDFLLQAAFDINELSHADPNMGFNLLPQALVRYRLTDDASAAWKQLNRGSSLLGEAGGMPGHAAFHRGLYHVDTGEYTRAVTAFQDAIPLLVDPVFTPTSLSRVYRELAALVLAEKPAHTDQSLSLAAMAFVLHPFGDNVDMFEMTVSATLEHVNGNRPQFQTIWDKIEEGLRTMTGEPSNRLVGAVTHASKIIAYVTS
jgi:tetratricopeptide (TPR) repeat protein